MILKVYKYGEKVLREKSVPVKAVTDALRRLADDMLETMHASRGVGLAAANFAKMMLVDRWLMQNPAVTPVVALVVCATLVGTVLCAKLVGCALPILAEKVGFDPAVMASPFISTIVDSISLLIYFQFASMLLGI